ncbi:MAG TPA: site-specific integrase [Blastocatellia bacterium]|nr:site-specific integrase [Blastocatellia bacterium]
MVRKIGSRWYYDFMIRRQRYRGVIPEARTKAQAETAEVKIRNKIFDRKYTTQADTVTIAEFVDKVYLPYARLNKRHPRNDELHCRAIVEFFGKKTFAQISPILIEKFKRERRESVTRYGRQRSAASVNRELEVLSKIFSLAMDNGIVESNPARKVKKLRQDNLRKRYLTVEEEQRLMGALTGRRIRLKPVVVLAIQTGMRRGELLNLKWQNIDLARGLIYVTDTKTGHDREVPINSIARETLLGLQRLYGGYEYVFTNPMTGLNITEVKKGFKAACREAGIADFRFHDLRHTTGTRLADAGTDAFAIAEVLGHRNLQTTKRYTHATELRKRRAVEALASYSEEGGQKLVKNEKGAVS